MNDLISREEAIKELKEDIELYIPLHGTIDDVDRDLPDGRLITALEMGIKALEQESKLEQEWETCFDCPLSHGCPKIKGCTNEQAIEYASKIPNDCPLSATDGDTISRQAAIDAIKKIHPVDTEYDCTLYDKIDVMYVLKDLPPVNPQLKTGHWIEHPEIKTSTPEYLMFYECSECGDKHCFCKSDIQKKHFCNNCGAKMIDLPDTNIGKMSEIPTGSDPQESEGEE